MGDCGGGGLTLGEDGDVTKILFFLQDDQFPDIQTWGQISASRFGYQR